MRLKRSVQVGVMVGLIAAATGLTVPAHARGGGGFGGGHGVAFGARSPGSAFHGARSPAFRSRFYARPFLGRSVFGQPYAAFVPFGFGYGLGFYGSGYGGAAEYGPGLPIYDVPPYQGFSPGPVYGPVYGQEARPPQSPDHGPVETAALISPVIPGAHPPPIPTVITRFEVRPGTLPAQDVAGPGPLPTVIAGR